MKDLIEYIISGSGENLVLLILLIIALLIGVAYEIIFNIKSKS